MWKGSSKSVSLSKWHTPLNALESSGILRLYLNPWPFDHRATNTEALQRNAERGL